MLTKASSASRCFRDRLISVLKLDIIHTESIGHFLQPSISISSSLLLEFYWRFDRTALLVAPIFWT